MGRQIKRQTKPLWADFFRLWAMTLLPSAGVFWILCTLEYLPFTASLVAFGAIAFFSGWGVWRRITQISQLTRFLEDTAEAVDSGMSTETPLDQNHVPADGSYSDPLLTAAAQLRSILTDQSRKSSEYLTLTETVLNSLPFPLLVISRDLEISQSNKAATVLFERPLIGINLGQIMRSPEIFDTVEKVFETGESAWREFKEFAGIESIYRVHMSPFMHTDKGMAHASALVMIEDVTERRRSEQMRVDFIANASHEIRTPLTAVRGMIETICGPAQNDPTAQKKFLGIMAEQVERLHHLVEDLMSLSRIELHEHSKPADPVSTHQIIKSVCRSLEWEAGNRGMTFRIEVPDNLPPLVGEDDEVERLVSNLVTNAIKYGTPDTEVRIAAYVHARPWQLPGWRGGNEAVAIAVADRGHGIPKEHIPRLTERFYRVDAARSRYMGGTGLGLAIVKHIIQRHRGALTIESVEEQGSVFTAFFPIYMEVNTYGSVTPAGTSKTPQTNTPNHDTPQAAQ